MLVAGSLSAAASADERSGGAATQRFAERCKFGVRLGARDGDVSAHGDEHDAGGEAEAALESRNSRVARRVRLAAVGRRAVTKT